jgi:hypothetical protein
MMKILVGSLALSVALVMSGCGTVIKSEHLIRSFTPMYHSPSISDYPAIGEVKTVEVGESLVGKDKQTSIPAIDIEQAIVLPAENLGKKFTITMLPGRYIESGKDGVGKFYQAKEGKALVDNAPLAYKSGIYVKDDNPKDTEFYANSNQSKPISYPRGDIPFTRSVHQTRDELSFKKELVYTGISQNVVSILYREFNNDMARPAFSQDLKYDLSESKVVGYRGARFEIIKATNQGLTYKTLKQLD